MTGPHLTAYLDSPDEPDGHRVAQVERARLCLLFHEMGPDAPTLCGEWDTHHLAAHLWVREANPWRRVNTVLPGRAFGAIEARVAKGDYAAVVDDVRSGPPRFTIYGTPQTDKLLNTLEFFVHHEDVRRAVPTFASRQLPRWAQDEIWGQIAVFAKLTMRKSPVGIVLVPSDRDDAVLAVRGKAPAVLRGLPTELALFAYGRGEVADVDVTGSADSVARLRETTFAV
ncbi:MAG: TIGR03085 family protein [Nocardioidaceae bacterium]|nr:TIGR03085 family protein [Nocardioidaceae bacterium]